MAHDAHDLERQRLGGETNAPPPIPMATTADGQMFVQAMANRVCKHLPEGWQLDLCMERGAAWVQLSNPDGDGVSLPDAADKSLEEQINDAICAATGFVTPNA